MEEYSCLHKRKVHKQCHMDSFWCSASLFLVPFKSFVLNSSAFRCVSLLLHQVVEIGLIVYAVLDITTIMKSECFIIGLMQ